MFRPNLKTVASPVPGIIAIGVLGGDWGVGTKCTKVNIACRHIRPRFASRMQPVFRLAVNSTFTVL